MKIMSYSTIIIIIEFVAIESSFATKSINFDRIPKINSVATKLKVAFNIIVAEVVHFNYEISSKLIDFEIVIIDLLFD
jgi:hypothetical protein